MEQKTPTGGEKVIQCLEREGVEYIFGLSGGAAMPLFDALLDSKIQLVLVRHEQGATHMADGYARSTGRPAGRAGGAHRRPGCPGAAARDLDQAGHRGAGAQSAGPRRARVAPPARGMAPGSAGAPIVPLCCVE